MMATTQILITLDSLRWDVFTRLDDSCFLKQQDYDLVHTHGTYTLPSHSAMFTGKLPSRVGSAFDFSAKTNRQMKRMPPWRLDNPESFCQANFNLTGTSIMSGFNRLGFLTVGTGAVSWFDTSKPAHLSYLHDFMVYRYFGKQSAEEQVDFVLDEMSQCPREQPMFLFINFGETHPPFVTKNKTKKTPWNSTFFSLFKAQSFCLGFLDAQIQRLFAHSRLQKDVNAFICSDHGTCFGEDGMFGHSFYHPKIMDVPMVEIIR